MRIHFHMIRRSSPGGRDPFDWTAWLRIYYDDGNLRSVPARLPGGEECCKTGDPPGRDGSPGAAIRLALEAARTTEGLFKALPGKASAGIVTRAASVQAELSRILRDVPLVEYEESYEIFTLEGHEGDAEFSIPDEQMLVENPEPEPEEGSSDAC